MSLSARALQWPTHRQFAPPQPRPERQPEPATSSHLDKLAGRTGHDHQAWPSRSCPHRRPDGCLRPLDGRAGFDWLCQRRWLRFSRQTNRDDPERGEWFRRLGVDVGALRAKRRPLCRPCLDRSEHRFHLAGSLGAALFDRLFAARWARRETGSRAVTFSPQVRRSWRACSSPPGCGSRARGPAPGARGIVVTRTRLAPQPLPRRRGGTSGRIRYYGTGSSRVARRGPDSWEGDGA
jgi:hypothetical protein